MPDYVDSIFNDVMSLKIQGATNVAYSVIDAVRGTIKQGVKDGAQLKTIAEKIANARANEPLARNAVKFIFGPGDIEDNCEKYQSLITTSKLGLIEPAIELLATSQIIMTHCHSSTTTSAIKRLWQKNNALKVITTETRPMFQGRITATELIAEGIETYMIVDSATSQFLMDTTSLPVDSVLIGCDEILSDGSIVNKIGSLDIALACAKSKKPVYVMTSLLKIDTEKTSANVKIEYRNPSEIWPDAPANLIILNPAFDIVDPSLITAFITEAGIIKPEDVSAKAIERYNWLL